MSGPEEIRFFSASHWQTNKTGTDKISPAWVVSDKPYFMIALMIAAGKLSLTSISSMVANKAEW